MYKEGDKVYLKKGRSLEGPYTVEKVNQDGTYDLKDGSGQTKSSVEGSLED